jgi:tetratricopeptide (TPR) repeat protein
MRPLVVVCILGLACASASAQESSARKRFEEGTTLYDLGQYVEAARAYEDAYRIKNDPALLFNIGQAYRLGGDSTAALRAYRSFLRRMPDAPNRSEVERHIVTLQKQIDEKAAKPFGPEPEPPPPPPPTVTTTPAPNAAVTAAALTAAPAPRADQPLYKKWWLWTIVGGVVVAGVAVGVAVAATTPSDASRPSGAMAVTF